MILNLEPDLNGRQPCVPSCIRIQEFITFNKLSSFNSFHCHHRASSPPSLFFFFFLQVFLLLIAHRSVIFGGSLMERLSELAPLKYTNTQKSKSLWQCWTFFFPKKYLFYCPPLPLFFFFSSSIFAYSYILIVNRIRFSERDLNKMISLLLCQLVPSHTCAHGSPHFYQTWEESHGSRSHTKEIQKLYNRGQRSECVYVCVHCQRERAGWRGEDKGRMCENWVQLFHAQVFLDTEGVKSPSHYKKTL